MGDRSAIEWTDATWNPVTGCSKVSPGCAHCYAATLAPRLARMGQQGYTELPWTPENAAANVFLHVDRLAMPIRWTRPRRIFVNSMSDLFHEQVPDEFILRVFGTMRAAPQHAFQVLTKRPDRMRDLVTRLAWRTPTQQERDAGVRSYVAYLGAPGSDPLSNVWLGTSVENQTWADRRIPELLATPAAVRFLSCEPLLGHVDLSVGLRVSWQCSGCRHYYAGRHRETCPDCGRVGYWTGSHAFNRPDSQTGSGIDWVIAGGESGPGARPMHSDWVRSLRDQCRAMDTAFLFKQWGQWARGSSMTRNGWRDEDLVIARDGRAVPWADVERTLARDHQAALGLEVLHRVGAKSSAGRELDGRTWDEYPAVPA